MKIGNRKEDICELQYIAMGDVFEYGGNFYVKSETNCSEEIMVLNMSNGKIELMQPTDWVRKDYGEYSPANFPLA